MRNLYLFSLALLLACQPTIEESPVDDAFDTPYLWVVGTAQDAGYPQAGCTKDCCAAYWRGERPHEAVTSVAVVLPTQSAAWLFDATPDFTEQYTQVTRSGATLRGIFPTHAHIGHYTGLMYLGKEAMHTAAMPVYAMPGMDTFLRRHAPWRQLVDVQNIVLHPLRDGRAEVLDPQLRVTPFRVPHRDEWSETVGFRIDGPERSAIYLPDIDKWERWAIAIDSLVATVDYALLDATFYDGNELPGRDMASIPHPFVVESMARLAVLPDSVRQRIYFTHFNHTNPLLAAESEASQAVEAAGFRIARTGLRLPL